MTKIIRVQGCDVCPYLNPNYDFCDKENKLCTTSISIGVQVFCPLEDALIERSCENTSGIKLCSNCEHNKNYMDEEPCDTCDIASSKSNWQPKTEKE